MPLDQMHVRSARPEDAHGWLRMREQLWPGSSHDLPGEIEAYFQEGPPWTCIVAEDAGGVLLGFVEVGLRDYAEGCLSAPVGYLEGIFVDEAWRTSGVGRALVEAAEDWARLQGCTEMASDRELDNEASGLFHQAVGYQEVERIVCFRKPL